MKTDVLVFAAHPDDAELSCSGTIAKLTKAGKKVVLVDLTQGEMGTRGTIETRKTESDASSEILKLADRIQLGLGDTTFSNDRAHQLPLIETIRHFQPDLVFCNALEDRHPDHGRGAELAADACFFSGLAKIESNWKGVAQKAWRPKLVLHYIQDRLYKPDFVVDISETWEIKKASIMAFKSQFYDPASQEPTTYISSPEFLNFIESRAREMGHLIGVEFGEGFHCKRPIGISDLSCLI
ncbi:MAG TPA: bacillithiol biosynthesis deacetylase BshB1 [Catalimonadaceae bacterium]|nr:bacillithiol biosynthesis deacetylase BshB1 [Catalimonadaceae bacterium]